MSAEQAIARSQEIFDAGERLEMGVLADRLGVNRATLYRWVGSRDALLGELVWRRLDRALAAAGEAVAERGLVGTARLGALLLGLFPPSRGSARSPMRRFVDAEPAVAMRVMTSGVVHARLIETFAGVIEEEAATGAIAPEHPASQVAELIVKTGEAVFWFDVASGRGLDAGNMGVLLDALCRPAITSPNDDHRSGAGDG